MEIIVIYLTSVKPSRVEVMPIIIPGVVQRYLEDDFCHIFYVFLLGLFFFLSRVT